MTTRHRRGDATSEPSAPQPPDLGGARDVAGPVLTGDHPGDLLEDAVIAGESPDLAGARILSSRLELGDMGDVGLRGARLADVVIAAPDCAIMRAPYGQWRDVAIEGGRIGTGEAYEAEWVRVGLRGVRIRYLNLRSARVRDLVLEDCVIDELDLAGAELIRVAFPGTRIGRLELGVARLEAVDLRGGRFDALVGARDLTGAVVDVGQVVELAPMLAAALGLRVV